MSIQHMQMAFDAGSLTSAEKSVLLAYCNFTDAHGYCWPGIERISDMTGASPRTVKRTRAALTERGLLGSKRRLTKSGQSITSMTRVNLDMLASLKRPPRVYDDNVIEEITFAVPDQGTCQDDTPATSEGATVSPPWGRHGPGEGDTVAPNPSGEPSFDPPSSSSATVEDVTSEAVPPVVEKKMKRDSPEEIVKTRIGCTDEEAAKVVTYVNQQGDGRGGRIRSLTWWVTNRDIHTLRQDLACVRGAEKPAGLSYEQDPGAYLRRINGHGHTPYKNPTDQSVYDESLLPPALPTSGAHSPIISQEQLAAMEEMSNEEKVAMVLGSGRPVPPARPSTADLRVQGAKDAARSLQAKLDAAGGTARRAGYEPYRDPVDSSAYYEDF